MNPLHLIWIVPLSMVAGAFCMALAAVNNRSKCKDCPRCEDCPRFDIFGEKDSENDE